MPNFDSNQRFNEQDGQFFPGDDPLTEDQDMLMEQILENMNTTPIGQVLKKIALQPEVRKDKVLNMRHKITKGKYDLNERLDVALDKVLEDLIA